MEKRMNIYEIAPNAIKAMMGLEGYLATTTLSKTHKELIKIRASQINGCAYCINMHTIDARKQGEKEQRIYALNAWRDTNYYTPEEAAILALTEEVTNISGHIKTDTYATAAKLLGEEYLAEVIMAITIINAWNRIAITTGMQPS